ncbi:hypothetical protein [Methylococcus capsulatus]|uniref:hypothetical protein n=1 Tax=Methylococcus capsulatus TaxID=414 RepID=UPI00211ACBF4|nr:hypothetical protein [Methylococcus capsulatus]
MEDGVGEVAEGGAVAGGDEGDGGALPWLFGEGEHGFGFTGAEITISKSPLRMLG